MDKTFSIDGNTVERVYIDQKDSDHLLRKLYLNDGSGQTLYYALPEVTFQSSLLSSSVKKDVLSDTAYGDFPTLTADSNRVDFWFTTDAVAKNDSTKKYVDYPWCAYADANSSLYSSYQYKEDLLAKHWYSTGSTSGSGYILGGLTQNSICTKEDSHQIQHVSRQKSIPVTITSEKSLGTFFSSANAAVVRNSNGGTEYALEPATTTSQSYTWHAQPGMTLTATAVQGGAGSLNPQVTLNGTKKVGNGSWSLDITKDIKSITVHVATYFPTKLSVPVGEYWQISITTT